MPRLKLLIAALWFWVLGVGLAWLLGVIFTAGSPESRFWFRLFVGGSIMATVVMTVWSVHVLSEHGSKSHE